MHGSPVSMPARISIPGFKMKSSFKESRIRQTNARAFASAPRLLVLVALLVVCLGGSLDASAQTGETAKVRVKKLPSPDKIVSDYLKAAGGRKRYGAIRDATYEWSVQRQGANGAQGTA